MHITFQQIDNVLVEIGAATLLKVPGFRLRLELDRILYQGFPEEYNELADIVKRVNDEIKMKEV